jgi:hypothetical protein
MTHKELTEKYNDDFVNLNNAMARMTRHMAVLADNDAELTFQAMCNLCQNILELGITHSLISGKYKDRLEQEDEAELPDESE